MSDNVARFDAADTVQDYLRETELTACEAGLVDRYLEAGMRVLDLGVGTGRTTGHLAPRASSYVGVDLAPAMIEAARRAHPTADLRVLDAADLSSFDDGAFDLVLFSYNGLDYLDDEARERCLREVHRVLRPGGRFLHSSHSPRALLPSSTPTGTGARRLAVLVAAAALRTGRTLATSSFWTGSGRYHDRIRGGLDTHAATPSRTIDELGAAGFRVLEVRPGDAPRPPRWYRTPWWYYASER